MTESTTLAFSSFEYSSDFLNQGTTVSTPTKGTSALAVLVQDQYELFKRTLFNPAKKIFIEKIEADIVGAWQEAHRLNWDGQGTLPVSFKTMQHAKELANVFPIEFKHRPQIFPDHKGGVVFEWEKEDNIITVAVRDSKIVYSALMPNGEKESGIIKFKGFLPKKILNLISELLD